MKRRFAAGVSTSGFVSVVLLYLFLVVLVLVFAGQLLSDITIAGTPTGRLIIVLAVSFPLFLLVTIVINIVRLVRDRRRGSPGASLRLRILSFFVFVVVLASAPQGILALNFINSAMGSLFSAPTGDALRGGLDIALDYYDERVAVLERFVTGSLFAGVLRDAEINPQRAWNSISTLRPEIDGFQVFDRDLNELFAAGNERTWLRPTQARLGREGHVVRERSEDDSFLRVRVSHPGRTGEILVVLTMLLPDGFDERAQAITSAIETFAQVEQMQGALLQAVALFFGLFSFPLFLLAILVSVLLSEEITRPIINLEEATRRVAEGDYSFRILTRSTDDLGLLVNSFNDMVSELERSRKKILQTEKVAAWQEIAQRLAHEIKNPLTPIKLSAERVLKKFRNDAEDFPVVLESAISSIITEVDGLNALLSEFRNFSRLPDPVPQRVSLKALVTEVVTTYATWPDLVIHTAHLGDDIEVIVDPGQIKQVLANLFTNATEAMSGAGEIVVRADLVKKGNSMYCRIQVQDTGPGIDVASHDKVFNPYYTTKRHGTGLGLSIVERIVFDHRGQIWFETQPGAGTTFFIDLPVDETS
ncbi:MAG: HAMP domain-containing protein [Spirochaetaceae bacterium]|nr:MAG: HAMP domain-containing protein [Spirochaetaceae bacterium]